MKLYTDKSAALSFSVAMLLGINIAMPATANCANPHDADNMYVQWREDDDDSENSWAIQREREREYQRRAIEREENAVHECRKACNTYGNAYREGGLEAIEDCERRCSY